MPAPYWLAKYIATPMKRRILAGGKWDTIVHVGRRTGETHRTPVEAVGVDGGFIVFVVYGSAKSDWVKNVLASGSARLDTKHGETFELTEPTIVGPDDAWALLPEGTTPAPGWSKVDEYLFLKH